MPDAVLDAQLPHAARRDAEFRRYFRDCFHADEAIALSSDFQSEKTRGVRGSGGVGLGQDFFATGTHVPVRPSSLDSPSANGRTE